jgi:hypothetical protein
MTQRPESEKTNRNQKRLTGSRKDHPGAEKITRTMITWKQIMIALTSATTPALAAYDR